VGVVPLKDKKPYSAPEPIKETHRLENFDCGKGGLNDWLRTHALGNEGKASRTYVVRDQSEIVVAYYTLATGSTTRTEVPKKLRHGLPNPVPVMILGRLAVDHRHSGQGLGPALLKEAMKRTLTVAREAGVRALIVHAIDDEAVTFYTKYGFQLFPPEQRTLFLPVETLESALSPE